MRSCLRNSSYEHNIVNVICLSLNAYSRKRAFHLLGAEDGAKIADSVAHGFPGAIYKKFKQRGQS